MGPRIVIETKRWTIDPNAIDAAAIAEAASLISQGNPVAFPTETVYGLGADGLTKDCVKRIFDAKGRPATNPIILHVSDLAMAKTLSNVWPTFAEKLAQAFWPGPLTVVVPKSEIVPDIVTANGPTVAIRCPNHPIALALIKAVNKPLAAPSANPSTQLSPTRAEHVAKVFVGKIGGIIDGGPCTVGIESTVVDCTGKRPHILRPGSISKKEIERIVGPLDDTNPILTGPVRSPGQQYKHYSPKTPIVLVDTPQSALDKSLANQSKGIRTQSIGMTDGNSMAEIQLPDTPEGYAAKLYDCLHDIDSNGQFDQIVIELPPSTAEWAGVRDRLYRAAGVKPAVFIPQKVRKENRERSRGYRR